MGVTPKAYTDDGSNSTGSGALSGSMDAATPAVNEDGALVASSNLAWTPQEPSHLDLYFPDHIVEANKMVAPEPVATVAAASVGQLTEAEMRAVLAEAGWPGAEVPNALRVSYCESRWSVYATNGVDNGLFGMSSAPNATLRGGWLTYWGFSEEQTFDPVVNATAALWTWQRSGWGPWSCRSAVY